MARLRLLLIGAIGLAAGTFAYRWASSDQPYDAPPPRPAAPPPAAAPLEPGAARPAVPDGPAVPLAVVDAQSALAVPGVIVTAENETQLGDSTSDADGRATMPRTAGRWRVGAVDRDGDPLAIAGGTDWQLGATPPPVVTVRVARSLPPRPDQPPLAPGFGALVGVVTVAGARAADVIVTPFFLGDFGPGHAVARDTVPAPIAVAPRRFVGTSGLFRLDGLAPGTYAAIIVAPGRGAAIVRATVLADLAGNLSADLQPAASLSGAVTDQRGALLSGAVVRVAAGGVVVDTVYSTRDGTYALHDLPPGPVELSAAAPRCTGDRVALDLPAGQRTVRALGLVCETPDPVVTSVPPVYDEP